MSDYNLVVLVGRVRGKPTVHHTVEGRKPYARFLVDVARTKVDATGNTITSKSIVPVTCWDGYVALSCKFLEAGKTVMVVGSLEHQGHGKMRVRANRIQFLDPVKEKNGNN